MITKYSQAAELVKPGSTGVILCNSNRWGGTGGTYAVMSLSPEYERILTYELGHVIGKLADEYWYSNENFSPMERVNKTNNGDLNTIKLGARFYR